MLTFPSIEWRTWLCDEMEYSALISTSADTKHPASDYEYSIVNNYVLLEQYRGI